MKPIRHFLRLLLITLLTATSYTASATSTDNVQDFDATSNAIGPGRWAYGWFGRGSITDPKKELRLFSQTYPEGRENMGHWVLDARKRERCWLVLADGRTYTDTAEIAWIYQVPRSMAGQVRITGDVTSNSNNKRVRIFLVKDEFISAQERSQLAPIYDVSGGLAEISLECRVETGELLYFVLNDTAQPSDYLAPQILHVQIQPAR